MSMYNGREKNKEIGNFVEILKFQELRGANGTHLMFQGHRVRVGFSGNGLLIVSPDFVYRGH